MADNNKKEFTYQLTTADGKTQEISADDVAKNGWESYSKSYPGATVRMRDKDNADYDVPVGRVSAMMTDRMGLHPFAIEYAAAAQPAQAPAQQPVQQPVQQSAQSVQPVQTQSVQPVQTVQSAVQPEQKSVQPAQAPAQQPQKKAQDRIVRVRRGGKDFEVLASEVNSAGGFSKFASQYAGAPLRVYMTAPNGKSYHVDAKDVGARMQSGWKLQMRADDGKRLQPTAEQQVVAKMQAQQGIAGFNAQAEAGEQVLRNQQEYFKRGGTGQTVDAGMQFNEETGRMEQTYLTPSGQRTSDKVAADAASLRYTRAVQAQKEYQATVSNAVDAAWDAATAADRSNAEADEYTGITSLGPAGPGRAPGAVLHDVEQRKAHKELFDFEKMTSSIYEGLPAEYRDNQIAAYTKYFKEHPDELRGRTAAAAAKEALRGEIYQAVYQKAVEANMPKSRTEFLLRKIAEMQPLSNEWAADVEASRMACSYGESMARDAAMSQFGSQHKFVNILGTVGNMMLDPTTYFSGAVGGMATKGAMRFFGKQALKGATAKVAERYAASSLAGRMVGAVGGGMANFGTYEMGGNVKEQLTHGGVADLSTGQSEGYSSPEVLRSGMHGVLLGGLTGGVPTLFGNVSDKLVKATASTAGKVGIKAGSAAASTLTEGTIFATVDYLNPDNDRSFVDVWDDSMAMILGFKGGHAVKSAPEVLRELKVMNSGKRVGFAEQLRNRLDKVSGDMAFTVSELKELKESGYGDMAKLFVKERKDAAAKREAHLPEGEELDFPQAEVVEEPRSTEFDGYGMMEQLMADRQVSEATRAKAYYILTGRKLAPSTVTDYRIDTAEDGQVAVLAMSADGSVVTKRRFKSMGAAQGEVDAINRQAELNSVDVGEQLSNSLAEQKAIEMACTDVAAERGMAPEDVYRTYVSALRGDDISAMAKEIGEAVKAGIDRHADDVAAMRAEAKRAAVNEKYGVDVDAAMRKARRDERTAEEQQAVEEYLLSLYPEEAVRNSRPPQGEANPEREIAEAPAKAAEDAAEAEGDDMREQVDRYTNKKTGMAHPATMKVDDRRVYIVDGNVQMTDDGTMVDKAASDKTVFVYDPATGKTESVDVNDIFGVDEPMDPNEIPDNAEAQLNAEQEAARVIITGPEGEEQGDVEVKSKYGAGYGKLQGEDGSTAYVQLTGKTRYGESGETEYDVFVSPQDGERTGAFEWIPESKLDEGLQDYTPTPTEEPEAAPEAELPTDAQVTENGDLRTETAPNSSDSLENEQQNGNNAEQQSALARIPKDEQGEPMFERADDVDTAWDGLVEVLGGDGQNAQTIAAAQVEQAKAAVDKLQKKAPVKKAPKLSGSPMAMAKQQAAAEKEYEDAMAQYNADLQAAQQHYEAWQKIAGVGEARRKAAAAQARAESEERQRIASEAAQQRFEEEQRVKAAKQAEQDALGANAVNPKIKEKWDAAEKIWGDEDEIALPDGTMLKGRYVLTEAGAASPSHDPGNAYAPTEGFPVDEKGNTINDRDYERDTHAQKIVEKYAEDFNRKAIQNPVIVSRDGVVLSGNNRTMSGQIAAGSGKDSDNVEYLTKYGKKYGFTPEQIATMGHPRMVFVPDDALPYTTETFARFNKKDMKSQSKSETAVKLGKTIPDEVFGRIADEINGSESLGKFYQDDKSVAQALGALRDAGIITEEDMPELVGPDGAITAIGKELVENALIGKALETDPDAVRKLISMPAAKAAVVMGLTELTHNRKLAQDGFGIADELSKAIDLVYRAKDAEPEVYVQGVPVSPFGRQAGLFDDEYGESAVTDGVVLLLADVLNSSKPSELRKVMAAYNKEASMSVSGAADMFKGAINEKEDILKLVNEHFKNATPKEQQAIVDAAIAARRQAAAAAGASADKVGGGEAAGETPHALQRGGEETSGDAGSSASGGRGDLQSADERPEGEIDHKGHPFVKCEDGTTIFGNITEDMGLTAAPIKLSVGEQNESTSEGYGLVHIEANHGKDILKAGFKSVEEFVSYVAKNFDPDNIRVGKKRKNGSPTYLIQVTDAKHDNTLYIELSQDGAYWNVNSGGVFRKGYSNKKETVAKTEPQQPNNAVSSDSSLSADEQSGTSSAEPNGESPASVSKGNTLSTEKQAEGEKSLAESADNSALSGADKLLGNDRLTEIRDRALGENGNGITVFEETEDADGNKGLRIGNKQGHTVYWLDDITGEKGAAELADARKQLAKYESEHDRNERLSKVKDANGFLEYLKSIGEADEQRGVQGYDIKEWVKQAKAALAHERELRDVVVPMLEALNPEGAKNAEKPRRTGFFTLKPKTEAELEAEKRAAEEQQAKEAYEKIRGEFSNIDPKTNDVAEILQRCDNVGDAIAALRAKTEEQRKVADDWQNRKYKGNTTIVEGQSKASAGDDYTTSIGAANERRRVANIRAAQDAAEEYDKFADRLVKATGYKEQTVQKAVEAASAEVNTEPTQAQIEAGNYKKGHVQVSGLDITIENPAGSVRKGVDAGGKAWETTMHNTYGYFKGTEGVDGDHIDVFLHTNMDEWDGKKAFVVDQTNNDGTFDEHKVMLGFNDKDEAMAAYLSNYDATWAKSHPGLRISEVSMDEFKNWVDSSHRKTKPFADYAKVEKITDARPTENLFRSTDEAWAYRERAQAAAQKRHKAQARVENAPEMLSRKSDEWLEKRIADLEKYLPEDELLDKAKFFEGEEVPTKAEIDELTDKQEEAAAYLPELWKERSRRQNEGLFEKAKRMAQQPVVPKPVKSLDLMSFTTKKDDKPMWGGVYYFGGRAAATNGFALISREASYPAEFEGSVRDKKGRVIEGEYPDVESVLKRLSKGKGIDVDVESLRRDVARALEAQKATGRTVLVEIGRGRYSMCVKADNAKLMLDAYDTAKGKARMSMRFSDAKDGGLLGLTSDDTRAVALPVFTRGGSKEPVVRDGVVLRGSADTSTREGLERAAQDATLKPKERRAAEYELSYVDNPKYERVVEPAKTAEEARADFEEKFAGRAVDDDELLQAYDDYVARWGRPEDADKVDADVAKYKDYMERKVEEKKYYFDDVEEQSDDELQEYLGLDRPDSVDEYLQRAARLGNARKLQSRFGSIGTPSQFELDDAAEMIAHRMRARQELERRAAEGDGGVRYRKGDKQEHAAKVTESMLREGVTVVHSLDELPAGSRQRKAIESGERVTGWYETATGRAYVYAPNIDSVGELQRSLRHEGVHLGLRELLGQERFDALCDRVWSQLMTADERAQYLAYVQDKSVDDLAALSPMEQAELYADRDLQRAAADEFMAFTGEDGRYNDMTRWQKFTAWVKSILRKMLGDRIKVSLNDVMDLLRRSEENLLTLQKRKSKAYEAEQTETAGGDNDVERQADSSRVADDSARAVSLARDRSDIRVLEEGLADERHGNSGDSERDRRSAESERLVDAAKKNGLYLSKEDIAGLGEKRQKSTGESEVYIDKASGKVYKVKNPYAKSPMKKGVQPEDAIYEHIVHNQLFPETRYKFEGISDADGDVRIVLSQKFVESYGQPTQAQIEEALAQRGLKPEGKYTYGNEYVSVTDVTGDNALLGSDGKVYFIDPIIGFKKPVKDVINGLTGADNRLRFIGEKGAARLDEREEATTRLDNLGVAREMETAGKDAKAIKMATGWERGADGKWRYETADFKKVSLSGNLHPERRRLSKAEEEELNDSATFEAYVIGLDKLQKQGKKDANDVDTLIAGGIASEKAQHWVELNEKQKSLRKASKTLDDYIDDEALFTAYPELRDVKVNEDIDALETGKLGSYRQDSNTLYWNDTNESTLAHEVQHIIQLREGFARGGNKNIRVYDTTESAKIYSTLQWMQKEIESSRAEFRKAKSELDKLNEAMAQIYGRADAGEINEDEADRLIAELTPRYEKANELTEKIARDINHQMRQYDQMYDSLDDAIGTEGYQKLAGEVESRNVQSRLGMTDEERRATLAAETEDVAREDQIFITRLVGSTEMRSERGDKEEDKSLVGVHNISEEKLLKALKLGGLANPSAAVVDLNKGGHSSYGDISLVMPSSLVSKKSGRNAGTWAADAYTPRFPSTHKAWDNKQYKRFAKDVAGLPDGMDTRMLHAFNSYIEDGNSPRPLAYLFLHERGEAPATVRHESKYPKEMVDAVKALGDMRKSAFDMTPEELQQLANIYAEHHYGHLKDKVVNGKTAYDVLKAMHPDLESAEAIGMGTLDSFKHDVLSSAKKVGEVDTRATVDKAFDMVNERGLREEFDRWLQEKEEEYEVGEYLFGGYTPSGNRRDLPLTLENVSKLMKKDGRAGAESFFSESPGGVRAQITKRLNTLDAIRKNKDKLVSHDEFEKIREVINNRYAELKDVMGSYARFAEVLTARDMRKAAAEYGVELSDEKLQELQEFRKFLAEAPTEYFETKFERPVGLNEFAAVVLPKDAPMEIYGAMQRAGLKIVEYERGNEADRKRALDEASAGEGIRFRKSDEIERDYPNWLDGTTTDSGKHSTQVEGTRKTYNKVGDWIEKNLGKDVSVLDASSGMGYGTADLRGRGFNIEDVEPYQSEERKANNPATYDSYDKIGKKYDFIISNAVLNVIPDDWRAGVLHNMAAAMNDGGRMFINTRRAGEEKSIKDKIELDSPREVLVKRNGKIASYQRFFTPAELKEWVESELGDGYSVEIANEKNSGTKGLAAVVVTKNNESLAKSEASGLGQPIAEADAPMVKVDAKVAKNREFAKNLENLSAEITGGKTFGAHELLYRIAQSFGFDKPTLDESKYFDLDSNVSLRLADHQGNANTFALHDHTDDNLGFVIKLSPAKFKDRESVNYLELVFYPDKIADATRQREIIEGLQKYLTTGDIGNLPKPDKYNGSGKFKSEAETLNAEMKAADTTSTEAKAKVVNDFSAASGLPIKAVKDLTQLESYKNATPEVKAKMERNYAWFIPETREIVISLDRHADVDDIKKSIRHEIIGHYTIREMIGDERADAFFMQVYEAMSKAMRDKVNEKWAKGGYDTVIEAVEEYMASLQEKPFEKFTPDEQKTWGKIKRIIQRILDKFFETLKLPKWLKITSDNELRWFCRMGWEKNKHNPENRGGVFSQARETVAREETGMVDRSRIKFRDGDMGLEESITESAVALSQHFKENRKLKFDAVKAIGGNLNHLRQAMAAQRHFDVTTVKSVADLARTLLTSGLMHDLSDGTVI